MEQREGYTMRTVTQWLDEYGDSHRNVVNKRLHWLCVPAIVISVIGLLRDIQANNGLSASDKSALRDTIGQLERHYFLEPAPVEPDLTQIAHRWLEETTPKHAATNGSHV